MTSNSDTLIENSPIARWLGFSQDTVDDARRYHLTFGEQHIGNPAIRALHGGAIASFLEFSSHCALADALEATIKITTINSDVNYLASSRAKDMQSYVSVLRLGRRIAFVEAIGWQDNKERPVAKATFRIRIGSGK